MVDFWRTCPYQPTEILMKTKWEPLASWRKVGMVWSLLSGTTMYQAATTFDRDHSTISHAAKNVLNAFENGTDPFLKKCIQKVASAAVIDADLPVLELQSMQQMEMLSFRLYPQTYNTKKIFCRSEWLDSKMGIASKRCKQQCASCADSRPLVFSFQ
jgi:hypothetical protein